MRLDNKLTIDQIAERLDVSRTTAYAWVGDLEIPRTKPQSEAQRKAADANRDRAQLKRDVAYAAGKIQFPELDVQPTFRDFICMYIAEGYKRNRNVVSICNSDPAVLQLSKRWMLEFAPAALVYKIQYHADQDIAELREFWGKTLEIDPSIIRFQRKSNSSQLEKRTWRSKHGVLTIDSYSTVFRSRLQAWIDLVRADWS